MKCIFCVGFMCLIVGGTLLSGADLTPKKMTTKKEFSEWNAEVRDCSGLLVEVRKSKVDLLAFAGVDLVDGVCAVMLLQEHFSDAPILVTFGQKLDEGTRVAANRPFVTRNESEIRITAKGFKHFYLGDQRVVFEEGGVREERGEAIAGLVWPAYVYTGQANTGEVIRVEFDIENKEAKRVVAVSLRVP